jgi:hypothetical protein
MMESSAEMKETFMFPPFTLGSLEQQERRF